MHTFFINTSKKSLKDKYEVLFDIHYENRTLVSLECPVSDWYDKEKGYLNCIKKMSEMIDGYVELNNAFNLIIYVDLSENEAYSSIKRDEFHDIDRKECLQAMQILFTHAINKSIVDELENSGRKPQNILIMFGEDKKFADFGVNEQKLRENKIIENLFDFIGLPDVHTINSLAKQAVAADVEDKISEFKKLISENKTEELIPGIRESYCEDLEIWYDEVIHNRDDAGANTALYERIKEIKSVERDRIGIEMTVCPYDCYACTVNKSALALSEINIALYLLKCVQSGSIYQDEQLNDGHDKRIMEFCAYTAEEISPFFESKKELFAKRAESIEQLNKLYYELGLARQLPVFDNRKFGLDKYGNKEFELLQQIKKEDNTDDEVLESVDIEGAESELKLHETEANPLFTKKDYEPFEFIDGGVNEPGDNATPGDYIECAINTRRHHINYLKKLKAHIAKVMSNYAGKSKENEPALLELGKGNYARPDSKEYRTLEEIEQMSKTAYETTLSQYMDFCSGGVVGFTDIEQQCNWFITRIGQIQASLKTINMVAIGILIGIIVLYMPFLIIQFEAIVENILTLATGLGSFLVPVLILYTVFGVVAANQRKKYRKAWNEFKEKSELVLGENDAVVKKYDKLLSMAIPALRWVYEYKLEVAYYEQCCIIADAKMEHHRRKLRDRVTALKNILSDLEYAPDDEKRSRIAHKREDIDYNFAFCSGKQNREFYSIIDDDFKEFEKQIKGGSER